MTGVVTMAEPNLDDFDHFREPIGPHLMIRQTARLASFYHMAPCEGCHPIDMAAAGLFYLGPGDTLQCYSCDMTFPNWHAQELDPIELHQQAAPECAHLLGVDSSNVPIPVPDTNTREQVKTMLRQKVAQMERNLSTVLPSVRLLLQNSHLASPPGTSDATVIDEYGVPVGSVVDPLPGHLEVPVDLEIPSVPAAHTWRDPPDETSVETPDSPPPEPSSGPEIDLELCKTSVTERLKTFERWPVPSQVHPADLAQAGFVYTGPQDRVQCAFCEGSLRNWQAGDVPSVEHQRHFPSCVMARNTTVPGTPNLNFLRSDRRRTSSPLLVPSGSGVHTIEDSPSPTDAPGPPAREITPTGIVTERPKHPNMAIEAARIASFRNWPQGKCQTPQQLAKAGFFYAGFNDSVKCFFCDGGLRNWEREDDPWHEHARWFPRCKYVRQVKGDMFVEQVLAEEGGKVPQSATYEGDRESSVGSTGHEGGEVRRVVEPREVTARMDSPVVQAVLNMDIPHELVRRAIEERLRTTGDDFPNVQALLEVVFALPASYGDSRPRGAGDPATGTQGPGQQASGQLGAGSQEAPRSLIEENRQLKEQRTCKICMDEEVCVVFVPCGHLVCCATCAPPLSKCPICRSTIRGTVRTYMS